MPPKRRSLFDGRPETSPALFFNWETPLIMLPFFFVPLPAWVGFGASLVVSGLVVLTRGWHGSFTYDTNVGPQKFHDKATPRIGGTALFLGFWAAVLVAPPPARQLLVPLGLCGAVAFLAGAGEDLWKKTRPAVRLAATAGAALSFCLLTGSRVTRLDLPLADDLLGFPFVSVAFTVFAIAGLMNAVNIIDGFHGLASGAVVLMTGAFGVVAAAVGDHQLLLVAFIVLAVSLGFLVFNFPSGHLFLGDGGAYVSGFWLACLAVMLPQRNPEVSAWVSLLIVIYPVIETTYSIFRKTIRRRHSPLQPDGLHLHMLVYRSFATSIGQALHRTRLSNPITSALLWCFCLPGLLVAILAPDQQMWLTAGVALQTTLYAAAYRGALAFRSHRPAPSPNGHPVSSGKASRTPQHTD